MEENFKTHKELLKILIDVLNHINNPANVKSMMLNVSQDLTEIHWFGLPILFKRFFEKINSKNSDPKLQGATIRLIAPFYPEEAKTLAEELTTYIDDIEWTYDKAMGLALAGRGLLEIDEEEGKKLIDQAVEYAYTIPDRSDRSIALCEMIPFLKKTGKENEVLTAFEKIVYAPKRLEAATHIVKMKNIDSSVVEQIIEAIPKDKHKVFYAIRASTLSDEDEEEAKRLCSKALEHQGNGIDDLKAQNEIFKTYYTLGRKEKANSIFDHLIEQLSEKIDQRPYMNILLDLIAFYMQHGSKKRGLFLFDKIKNKSLDFPPSNQLYILTKLGNLLSEEQCYDESLNMYQQALNVLGEFDELTMNSSVMSIGSSLLSSLNHFPQDFPQDALNKILSRIKSQEKTAIEIEISEDNLEFLKQISLETTLGEKIDELILSKRRKERLEIRKQVYSILEKLIDKEPRILVNYLLQYIHSISIQENERNKLITILSKASGHIVDGNQKQAKSHILLVAKKLNDQKIPFFPVVLTILDKYLLSLI